MTELSCWLALWRTPGVGPSLFHGLCQSFGSPAAALEARPGALRAAGLSETLIAALGKGDQRGVEQDLEWSNRPGNRILTLQDPLYPPYLKEIAQPPPLLFVAGEPHHLSEPQLAMVGTRHPSTGGRENARAFAEHLAQAGLVITSGLALGIDGICHEAALAAGRPTVAVAAHGLDRIYPARHHRLGHRIVSQGALVSEFPIGVAPIAAHFPRRNRLISGLSLGTLVVEATPRSGSLITARFAMEQGREVYAIPGSIHNPGARGCHHLIRQGAKLVETAEHVLEEMPPLGSEASAPQGGTVPDEASPATLGLGLDGEYLRVLAALGHDPAPIDTIIERSGLTTEAVSSMLLILELHGHVALDGHGQYTRLTAGV